MSVLKISEMTEVSSPALDAQEVPVNDAGTTKKIVLGTDLKPWIGRMIINRSVADQAISATTAYVIGSALAVPTGKLRAGTTFRWRISMGKSAAGGVTAGSTFLLKIGTLGTTSDATIATLTTGTPTNVTDTAYVELSATIRTIGTAATSRFSGVWTHNLAATGFGLIPHEVWTATGATFDSTTANLIVGITITTTAGPLIWTLGEVVAEAEYL